RGGQGIANMEITAKNGAVVCSFPVAATDQVMLVTDTGRLIRTPVHDVRIARRQTQGVTVLRVDEGERVVSVTRLAESDADEDAGRITVEPFSILLMHFAQAHKASMIVRGLRAVSDFEYEFQMAGMNAKLDADIETVFLMAADGQQFVSSRFVKEIGRLGGD